MPPIAKVLRYGRVQSNKSLNTEFTKHTGLKLPTLKKTLHAESDSCKPIKRDGSFAKLQYPSHELFSDASTNSCDELEALKPPHLQNTITITTELQQTRGVAFHKIASIESHLLGSEYSFVPLKIFWITRAWVI